MCGWPTYMPHTPLLRQYWENRSHLSVLDDLLLYDDHIVIPRSMRLEILDRIRQGHLGITKCRARARTSVWWPGLSKSIEDMISKCVTCAKKGLENMSLSCQHRSHLVPGKDWEWICLSIWGKST